MDVLILAAKSSVAVILLIAGGAKLADLPRFSTTLRLFLPRHLRPPLARSCAAVVVLAELAAGAASLAFPAIWWLNPVVFVLACAFVVVSVTGYILFRGRSCQCFGSLSRRKFDLPGIARSAALAALAALAMLSVDPAHIQIGVPAKALLLSGVCLVALAAFTAARALDVSYDNLSGR